MVCSPNLSYAPWGLRAPDSFHGYIVLGLLNSLLHSRSWVMAADCGRRETVFYVSDTLYILLGASGEGVGGVGKMRRRTWFCGSFSVHAAPYFIGPQYVGPDSSRSIAGGRKRALSSRVFRSRALPRLLRHRLPLTAWQDVQHDGEEAGQADGAGEATLSGAQVRDGERGDSERKKAHWRGIQGASFLSTQSLLRHMLTTPDGNGGTPFGLRIFNPTILAFKVVNATLYRNVMTVCIQY